MKPNDEQDGGRQLPVSRGDRKVVQRLQAHLNNRVTHRRGNKPPEVHPQRVDSNGEPVGDKQTSGYHTRKRRVSLANSVRREIEDHVSDMIEHREVAPLSFPLVNV